VTLREATAADLPVLVSLVRAAFEEYRDRLDPPSGALDETEETLGQALGAGFAVIAYRDREAVGCAFYHRERDHLYLGRLSVLPAFRRHGIAQALTAYVEQRARALRVPRVQLGVRTALPFLRAYYERLGYRVVRQEAHVGYAAPTSVVMEKELP